MDDSDEALVLLREIRDSLVRQEAHAAEAYTLSKTMRDRQEEALETQRAFSRSYRKMLPVLLGVIAFVVSVICFLILGMVKG